MKVWLPEDDDDEVWELKLHMLGIMIFRLDKAGASLWIVSFWRRLTIAVSPGARWVDWEWGAR